MIPHVALKAPQTWARATGRPGLTASSLPERHSTKKYGWRKTYWSLHYQGIRYLPCPRISTILSPLLWTVVKQLCMANQQSQQSLSLIYNRNTIPWQRKTTMLSHQVLVARLRWSSIESWLLLGTDQRRQDRSSQLGRLEVQLGLRHCRRCWLPR